MRPFLFELSGEHESLPRSEAIACIEAECEQSEIKAEGPGYLVASFPPDRLKGIADRIALSHRIGEYLGTTDIDGIDDLVDSLEIPEGSFAVRVRRFEDRYPKLDSLWLAKRIGGRLDRKVDLSSPEVELRVLVSDRIHIHITAAQIDRGRFEGRKVQNRPFFSPISLHPRYARALVNLTRVRKGERLLDPFCGTGGILMEAALIGVRALGSDLAPHMVDGCLDNMRHFDIEVEAIKKCDVGEILNTFGKVDAIATDPPYGRSTSTNKEDLNDLYMRSMGSMSASLREGGGMGLVLPTACPPEQYGLRPIETHRQRVHRSLTRTYCVFRKQ